MLARFRIESSEAIKGDEEFIKVSFVVRLVGTSDRITVIVVIPIACVSEKSLTDSELISIAKLHLEENLGTNPLVQDGAEFRVNALKFDRLVTRELI